MTLSNSRVLVIGGGGFLGSHLVDQLTQEPVREIVVLDNFARGARTNLCQALQDERVRIVEGSITDLELLRDLMQDTDYVFHLAALWLYECEHQPRAALEVNVVGTYNVIETAQQAGVKKVVYSSSASVYGDAIFTPMTEDHPFNNRTFYGATKVAGEQMCRAFHHRYGLDYVGLRYMNVYGPRQDARGVYTSVIMKVLDRIDRGLAPIVYGDGSQTYDFVYVEDVARANVLAAKSDATDRFYNVGCGIGTSVRELVELLLKLTGSSLEIQYEPAGETFVTQRIGSPERAKRDLGFEATTDLTDGLLRLIAWRRGQKQEG